MSGENTKFPVGLLFTCAPMRCIHTMRVSFVIASFASWSWIFHLQRSKLALRNEAGSKRRFLPFRNISTHILKYCGCRVCLCLYVMVVQLILYLLCILHTKTNKIVQLLLPHFVQHLDKDRYSTILDALKRHLDGLSRFENGLVLLVQRLVSDVIVAVAWNSSCVRHMLRF